MDCHRKVVHGYLLRAQVVDSDLRIYRNNTDLTNQLQKRQVQRTRDAPAESRLGVRLVLTVPVTRVYNAYTPFLTHTTAIIYHLAGLRPMASLITAGWYQITLVLLYTRQKESKSGSRALSSWSHAHNSMAAEQEELTAEFHGVKHKKQVGVLLLTSLRVAWAPGDIVQTFQANYPYQQIKGDIEDWSTQEV